MIVTLETLIEIVTPSFSPAPTMLITGMHPHTQPHSHPQTHHAENRGVNSSGGTTQAAAMLESCWYSIACIHTYAPTPTPTLTDTPCCEVERGNKRGDRAGRCSV